MAIEHVYIWNNSSIIQDEVLAHRLGLVPLNVDPREFQAFPDNEEAEATDENTIVFKLDVTCTIDPAHPNEPNKAIHSSGNLFPYLYDTQNSQHFAHSHATYSLLS